ncbi:MAG: VOC family protein [Alphaproteobacteria bacterium]|nr:VOC family protein [Alphaproteobacteria bacterium]
MHPATGEGDICAGCRYRRPTAELLGEATMNPTSALQRASIFVGDTDRSLELYRDILGMTVVDRRDLQGPVIAKILGLADCKIRVTYLTAEDSEIARVGLFEVYDPRPPALARPRTDVIHRGQITAVFDSPHIAAIHRAVEAKGYAQLCKPTSLRGSKGGTYTEYMFFDPDGAMIDLLSFTPDPGGSAADGLGRAGAVPVHGTNKTSPLLRASIFVRDIERSLALYRDVLGLSVIDRREFGGAHVGALFGMKECKLKAAYLTANDSPLGRIGLFEVFDPRPPELPRPPTHSIHRGQTAIVMSTGEMRALHGALKKQGVAFLCEPNDFVRPGVGTYTEMIFFDPDGIPVSLIQFTAG